MQKNKLKNNRNLIYFQILIKNINYNKRRLQLQVYLVILYLSQLKL